MFDVVRRLLTAALIGGYLAVAPSTAPVMRWATAAPPAIVLGVGEPTPSVAVRPHR